jgi:hypothetical protein
LLLRFPFGSGIKATWSETLKCAPLKGYCFNITIDERNTKRVCTDELGQVTINITPEDDESTFNPLEEVIVHLDGFSKIGSKTPQSRSFKIKPGKNKITDPIKL